MQVTAMLVQADTRTIEVLDRLATAQVIMAVAVSVLVFLSVGGMIMLLLEYRAARRFIRTADVTMRELRPRLAPLLDRAKHVTNDVAGMTDNMRRKVDDVLHTVEELRRSLVRGGAATEDRVRRFAAVLDVVQSEAEDLLLDAAATARGVHETARSLNQPRHALRRPRPDLEERDE